MNIDEQSRALLNESTLAEDMPARTVGPLTLDVPSLRRDRYVQRILTTFQQGGAGDVELLYAWLVAMSLPLPRLREASVSLTAWEDVLDATLQEAFGGLPSVEILQQARSLFDDDIARITAAKVEIQPRPGSNDKDAPPNS